MSDIDKLIRMHQQALIAAQAAKIMKLERENLELQKSNTVLQTKNEALVKRDASRVKWMPVDKKGVQA